MLLLAPPCEFLPAAAFRELALQELHGEGHVRVGHQVGAIRRELGPALVPADPGLVYVEEVSPGQRRWSRRKESRPVGRDSRRGRCKRPHFQVRCHWSTLGRK